MSNHIYTIYKIINLLNNKIYIGFTSKSIRERFNGHIYDAMNRNSKYYLHKSIRKYKPENFIIESIYESIDQDHTLKIMEPYFIKECKSNNRKYGYNMTQGGEGTFGRIFSKKQKLNMSNRMKGDNNPTRKYGNPMKNKHHSEETKKKIGKIHKGKIMSKEAKQKISKANKGKNNFMYGKHHSKETRQKLSKPVYQFNKNGKLLNKYDSIREAGIKNNIKCVTTISACCKGKRKLSGGFIWMYVTPVN